MAWNPLTEPPPPPPKFKRLALLNTLAALCFSTTPEKRYGKERRKGKRSSKYKTGQIFALINT